MRDLSQFPTVAAYLAWAKTQGCAVDLIDGPADGPAQYRMAIITAPGGDPRVLEIFQEETDVLMSTTIARLDRRLGLKSAFFV
jgi:hypothetical protein